MSLPNKLFTAIGMHGEQLAKTKFRALISFCSIHLVMGFGVIYTGYKFRAYIDAPKDKLLEILSLWYMYFLLPTILLSSIIMPLVYLISIYKLANRE